jgi:alkyl sulfatase BDS1-like metallo-beta-lactamase superfamily hydrolase
VATPQYFRFVFTDTGETVTVERRGMIEIPRLHPEGGADAAVDAEVRTTRMAFAALLGGRAQPAALMAAGQLAFSGDVLALQTWLASHSAPDPGFNVVAP